MDIRVMKSEDYDKLYELWMTIKGFGIRSIDDSREGVTRFLKRNPTTSMPITAPVGRSILNFFMIPSCLFYFQLPDCSLLVRLRRTRSSGVALIPLFIQKRLCWQACSTLSTADRHNPTVILYFIQRTT